MSDGEARKYRLRLRDAEADCDRLAATLTGLQRRSVERHAAAHHVTPEALWAVTGLDGLLDDDGEPDIGKIADAAQAAADTLGISAPAPVSAAGLSSGAMPRPAPAKPWQSAFKAKQ